MLRELIALYVRPFFDTYTYTIQRGVAKGLKRKGGIGFLPINMLSQEERFLLDLDLQGQTVYDIGGWEGVITLFFARAVGVTGKVITFEPNPNNFTRISENLLLNQMQNVCVLPVALGEKKSKTSLIVVENASGRGSIHNEIKHRMSESKHAVTVEVDIDSLDNQVALRALPAPNFVKIDVEGLELDVLNGMTSTIQEHKPKLFIEVHHVDSSPDHVPTLIEWLNQYDYSLYSVELQREITLKDARLLVNSHLFCVKDSCEK
jgi:FkbM family methyltransferase